MNDLFLLASLALLAVFTVTGLIDGLYLHLWRYRLHARAESRREHVVHAARAVLFVPALALVFVGTTSGAVLWLGLALITVDFVVQILDTRVEATSRAFQGGLPDGELAIHVLAATAHFGLIVTSLLSRPVEAFARTVPIDGQTARFVSDTVLQMFLGGSVLVAALHVALLHPAIVRWTETRWPAREPAPGAVRQRATVSPSFSRRCCRS